MNPNELVSDLLIKLQIYEAIVIPSCDTSWIWDQWQRPITMQLIFLSLFVV